MTRDKMSKNEIDTTDLKSKFRGKIITRDDNDYNEARKVYNGMIDKYPLLIVKCKDEADVIAAVNFGRENNLLISVRGGGHNAGGLGICNDGLVIDLSYINYVHVDQKNETVRVGGGAIWGDVDHATHQFKLAIPTGTVSTTGVGGLALGGGVGYLTRKFGLTVDNILEVDMVLADGTFVTASSKENSDLYWAVRGGGGNYGVITSFLFKAHPVHTNIAGPTLWDINKMETVLKWYREFILTADKDLYGFFAILTVPSPPFPEVLGGKKMCAIVWCYLGDHKNADKVFKPVRDMKPDFEHIGPMPHPSLNSMFDPLLPPGLQWYWKADFINEIPDEAIKMHAKYGNLLPTPLSQIHIYPINGKAHEVSNNDTPWAYRDANWAQVIVGIDPDPANKDVITKWARDYYDGIHPYSAGGAYVNFIMDEGQDSVKASYKNNYERLAKLKSKYDPNNLFRVNQNIKPA
jgi:FAD/FMN-containing dehydrogenase